MPANALRVQTVRNIIAIHCISELSYREISKLFNVAPSSVAKYLAAFERSSLSLSDTRRMKDGDLIRTLAPRLESGNRRRQRLLFKEFPSIHSRIEASEQPLLRQWKKYRRNKRDGLSYSRFCQLYNDWLSRNGLSKIRHYKWTIEISDPDIKILKTWRSTNNKKKWQRAVALLDLNKRCSMTSICRKLERSPKTIKKWRTIFLAQGISSLEVPSRRLVSQEKLDGIQRKKERLVKIIHEPPSIHGFNRTTWTLQSLSGTYRKIYGEVVSKSCVSQYFSELGYKFKKARKVLTSRDPDYRSKLASITAILSRLGVQEKFFSIDEFGPCAIKHRGGVALVPADEARTVPQRQRSKGSLICTAALELSTNQVTHFFSDRKNTGEMIKMLELLITKYADQERIYLSWDAASWHASKAFLKRVNFINAKNRDLPSSTPKVELAPLPSGAQFLNVIESVFSGLARAVIHNSDYHSVSACKAAIDQHFVARNAEFSKNPRRAGKKIWGRERVPPVFSETNNCKDPRYR